MASEPQTDAGANAQPPPATHSWLWYMIGIVLVAVVLLTWLALFIFQQTDPQTQLQLEQVRTMRALWQAKGSKDYQMVYTVQRSGVQRDQFYVVVSGGKVQRVVLNGTMELPEEQFGYRSMTGLFNDIEKFLSDDARPGAPATFCRGYFNSKDGHLELFVRRVVDGPERVEIKVQEFKPAEGK